MTSAHSGHLLLDRRNRSRSLCSRSESRRNEGMESLISSRQSGVATLQRTSRPWGNHLSTRAGHAEAAVSKPRAVTPDYPPVSNFDRDFLGLSSHSQWSSMLHLVRYHRSRFEGRYQAGVSAAVPLSPRPSSLLRRPLWPCHSRITALGPAFRVLEYYRARHGAAPRHPPLSHPASCFPSCSPSLPL